MAGITITVKDEAAQKDFQRLLDAGENLTSWYKNVREIMLASVRENFERGGRPRWKPLKKATIQHKGHARPLIGKGILMNVVGKSDARSARVGVQPAARKYAAHQNFGSLPQWRFNIPARPFLVVQKEDEREILELAEEHIKSALTRVQT